MAQYTGKAVIPLEEVRRDFFSHLTPHKIVCNRSSGSIILPLMRIEHSQKSAKGVRLQDLAEYLDNRRQTAKKERFQIRFWLPPPRDIQWWQTFDAQIASGWR